MKSLKLFAFFIIFFLHFTISFSQTIVLKKVDVSKIKAKVLSGVKVYEMSSDFKKFGGISGLKIISPKDASYPSAQFDFYFLSDDGFYLKANPEFDKQNNLKSFKIKNFVPLKSEENKILMGDKTEGDAEAIDIKNGDILIAFERNHRVLRYANEKKPDHFINPENFKNLISNEGIEAMGFIKNQLLLITENSKASPQTVKAYLYRNNILTIFYYPLYKNYNPTDLTILNDNEILVLERSYTPNFGNRARILTFQYSDIKENEIVRPKQLVKLKPPFPLDNYEAIGNIQITEQLYKLFIVSDNNFNPKQKNLLIEFNYKK
jgi:hypothetical protein